MIVHLEICWQEREVTVDALPGEVENISDMHTCFKTTEVENGREAG